MKLRPIKHNLLTIPGTALTVLCFTAGYAQEHAPSIPANRYPAISNELQRQGHFAVSAEQGQRQVDAPDQKILLRNPSDDDRARYNTAVAALKANRPGAAEFAQNIKQETVNPTYSERIAFALARHYFRLDKWPEAIAYYEEAGIQNLDNDEVADQKFELAYCYFNNRQFDKARPLFSAIKEIKENRYYMAANYYYGLLCYNENRYDEALASFERVKEEAEYKAVVPYYIAEIYYFKGEKKRAFAQADSLIKGKEQSFYHKELHLLAAQCLFEAEKYAEARPYFEYYYRHAEKIRKEDLYEIAYTYYRLGEWKSAIDKFRMLSDAQDSLGQTSMYLLGDCYLKTFNKASARNAFGICADMSFNRGQQEAAMILYARLSFETGNKDEALRSVNNLLATYPDTKYKDEAQTLLSALLLQTNNYERALDHLQQVKVKDNEYWRVYQKATYGYGVQQFLAGDMNSAETYFGLSLKNPVNPEFERAAYFWRGEVAFHQKRYTDAINYSQNFISRNGNIEVIERISPQATIQHAYLNMGYAAMETDNYVAAQDYFSQARQAGKGDHHSAAVAMLLEADAVFLQKNYTKAITLYEKIIAAGGADADYARYQKAILLGLLGKYNDKIALLESLTTAKPPSVYAGNARYEIALTYLELDNYKSALNSLKLITDKSGDMSLQPKAWMKTGFVYQQMNDVPKAIDAYRHVVVNYPAAEERFAAMEALKGLYIQNNQPGLYSQLLRESGLPSADSSSMDSTFYAAGEAQYAAGKWENAERAFNDYLKNYPNGTFAVKAHYYLGEVSYRMKKYPVAKTHYDMVLATPWNDFSENSARRAAVIALDQKDYEAAFKYYSQLRSNITDNFSPEYIYRGLMKSGFYSNRYNDADAYADTLLGMSGASTESTNEAKFFKARILQLTGKDEEAMAIYRAQSGNKNGEMAAESRYHIAEILMKQDHLKEAEEAANETINLSAGFDTWVGKAYLLLADILVKQNDYFNAKALLQSIVKNTKIAELKAEASKKLDEVKKLEKKQSKLED